MWSWTDTTKAVPHPRRLFDGGRDGTAFSFVPFVIWH
jgi:hypothetical protein